MTFTERIRSLGFSLYQDYLASEHWKSFRSRYRRSGRPMRCAVCNKGPIQLHHHTYSRLGQEFLGDVTPLCRAHHVAVHDWIRERNKPVSLTHKAIYQLRKVRGTKKAKPKKQQRNNRSLPLNASCEITTAAKAVLSEIAKKFGEYQTGMGRHFAKKVFNAAWDGNLVEIETVKSQVAAQKPVRKKTHSDPRTQPYSTGHGKVPIVPGVITYDGGVGWKSFLARRKEVKPSESIPTEGRNA